MPLVEQRDKPTLIFAAMTQNRALINRVRKSRIIFVGLVARKFVYCLANILLIVYPTTLQVAA